MAKLKRLDLEKCFNELVQVMGLTNDDGTPLTIAPESTVTEIKTKIIEAAGQADAGDEFSNDCWGVVEAVRDDMGVKVPATEAAPAAPAAVVPPAEGVVEQFNNTTKLAEMKDMVGTFDEFKSLREGLDKYTGLAGTRQLRDAMAALLTEQGFNGVKAVVGRNTGDGKGKGNGAEKVKKPKGEGVIATIVKTIEESGEIGVSKETLLSVLKSKFPDRKEDSMKSTINVQVPARINKERWPMERLENGNYRKKA